MNLEYIIRDLKKFLSEHLNVSLNGIKNTSLIVEELGADSIILADLFVYIEDVYEVILDERFIFKNALSIKDIAETILLKIGKY